MGDFLHECLTYVITIVGWGHSGHRFHRRMGRPGWLIPYVISANSIFLSLQLKTVFLAVFFLPILKTLCPGCAEFWTSLLNMLSKCDNDLCRTQSPWYAFIYTWVMSTQALLSQLPITQKTLVIPHHCKKTIISSKCMHFQTPHPPICFLHNSLQQPIM